MNDEEMSKEDAIRHIEIFVRNKVREGYRGLFPKRNARKNVYRRWKHYKNKGANLDATRALGGDGMSTEIVHLTTERILNSEQELKAVLKGDYTGSHEELLSEIWKD